MLYSGRRELSQGAGCRWKRCSRSTPKHGLGRGGQRGAGTDAARAPALGLRPDGVEGSSTGRHHRGGRELAPGTEAVASASTGLHRGPAGGSRTSTSTPTRARCCSRSTGCTWPHDTMGERGTPGAGLALACGHRTIPFVITATGRGHRATPAPNTVSWWPPPGTRAMAGGVRHGRSTGDGVPLAHGAHVPVAFAVWSGVAGERAGLKSYHRWPTNWLWGDEDGGIEQVHEGDRSASTSSRWCSTSTSAWAARPARSRARRSGPVATAWTRCGGTS